ncbi:MAG: hypothetical protein ACP5SH_25905 [Syntrophobacteraceae bacterium]
MVRLLVFLALIWGAWHLLKKLARVYFSSFDTPQDGESGAEADLIQDPQCGAYFMKTKGVKGVIDGHTVYFCSRECYDRYRESRNAN